MCGVDDGLDQELEDVARRRSGIQRAGGLEASGRRGLATSTATLLVLFLLASVPVAPAAAATPEKNGKVAFVSNRDVGSSEIYTVKPDGTGSARITFPTGGSGDPAFSPDGTKIAFKSPGNDIHVMDANGMNSDGTGSERLTNTPVVESQPAFSPDGTKIAFVASAFEVDGSTDSETGS